VEAPRAGRREGLDIDDEVIRAAGAVAWRRSGGRVEVVLVHRPKYDDWSFPKGKAEEGESDEDCAVREVEEETGLHVNLGPELVSTSYESKGRPKRVRYWLAEPRPGEDARPQNEVDEVAWLTPGATTRRLTYDRDRDVLRSALERLES
jgi:8-oxo-dGTP diphosphatase